MYFIKNGNSFEKGGWDRSAKFAGSSKDFIYFFLIDCYHSHCNLAFLDLDFLLFNLCLHGNFCNTFFVVKLYNMSLLHGRIGDCSLHYWQ